MKRLLLLTLLALIVMSSVQLPAAISAYAFGDYYFVLKQHKPELEDQNGFWLRRVYLTYESDISDKLKARARLELNSPGSFSTSASNITPYLKDAYISYQYAPLHKLTVGIQDSLAFSNIEKFYGYRHLEKTMFDLYKNRSSRDFAIDFSGAFDAAKKFNYSVQYGNYSGNKNETDKYKQVGARLFVNVTPELLLEVTRRMAGYETLDEVLKALVEMTTSELNAERGSLFLNDPDTNELYSRVAQGNIQREIRILNILKPLEAKKKGYDGKFFYLYFRESSPIDPAKIISLSRKKIKDLRLTPDLKLFWPAPGVTAPEILDQAEGLLKMLAQ